MWKRGIQMSILVITVGCGGPPAWEAENPVLPLPEVPLGAEIDLMALPNPPTPERVRLGRWLFYDTRLSADDSVACATCHQPEFAFSEPTAVSTGIAGQRGTRKAPSFVNQADTLYPHFFWDGRAGSLEEQALGPIANPIEMGNTPAGMVEKLAAIPGYVPYFTQAFGTSEITAERVAEAIVSYERTRMSGNSPWDRWRYNRDESAVSDAVKRGHELFFGRAGCRPCHAGNNFTDSNFHNLGVGWDAGTGQFDDDGRFAVTGDAADRGRFKTPALREVSLHPPYMHNGSMGTLRDVIEHYNRGGVANPNLDVRVEPLGLSEQEIEDLVAFLEALEGEGYQDTPPTVFPR